MPASPYIVILSIIVTLLAPVPAHAQSAEPPSAEPGVISAERRYLVEVIVFNYLGPISAGGELWHRESLIQFDPEIYTQLPERPGAPTPLNNPIPETRAEENPVRFTELKHLLPYFQKLSSDSRYEVLTRVAWTQPLYDKRDSVRVPLTLSPPDTATAIQPYQFVDSPVKGGIRIFENRLLFVDLDITDEFLTGVPDYSAGARSARPAGVYQLREKRRVKLNEIHFFDHPFFGALIRVSRVEQS